MLGDAHDSTSSPLPSVFISYASEDRAAARALRDILTAAGLEVWLDEDELAGGEAWDAKLRNQIKTCTYFMPVISAATEARREGYFRREWRLAVERTLDFADDVLFLVPVVIDDTRDAGARVPEKFFTVQWLRVPGGQTTTALQELARRLAAHETGPASAPPPPSPGDGARPFRRTAEPPPFPKFPDYPEHGHKGRFAYDLVLWFGHLIHSLWCHLPRWLRVVAAFFIIFNLISWIFRESKPDTSLRRSKAEIAEQVKKSLGDTTRPPKGKDKAAAMIESLVGATAAAIQSGRPVTLIPFGGEGVSAEAYADKVFADLCDLLQKDGQPQWGVSPLPLKPDAHHTEAVARGRQMKSRFVLTGHVGGTLPGTAVGFTARLFATGRGGLVWEETFETATNDAATIARRIADEVNKRLELAPPADGQTP